MGEPVCGVLRDTVGDVVDPIVGDPVDVLKIVEDGIVVSRGCVVGECLGC